MIFSERLGDISEHQLQEAANRFELGQIEKTESAISGLFGQNIFVTVKNPLGIERWVFRGAPHWPWQFDKEKYFVSRLAQSTEAPVPWPYYTDDDVSLFGWPYAWLKWLPGDSPTDQWLSANKVAPQQLATAIARTLGELHRLRFPVTGEYNPETDTLAPEPSFAAWVSKSLDSWIEKVDAISGAFDNQDKDLIGELRDTCTISLNEHFEPQFVHYDFKLGNINLKLEKDGCRLTGVFDFMTAAAGDGEQDFSRILCELQRYGPIAVKAFLRCYRNHHELRNGYRERFSLYLLMDRLVIWEYGKRNNVWFDKSMRFRQFLEPYLQIREFFD